MQGCIRGKCVFCLCAQMSVCFYGWQWFIPLQAVNSSPKLLNCTIYFQSIILNILLWGASSCSCGIWLCMAPVGRHQFACQTTGASSRTFSLMPLLHHPNLQLLHLCSTSSWTSWWQTCLEPRVQWCSSVSFAPSLTLWITYTLHIVTHLGMSAKKSSVSDTKYFTYFTWSYWNKELCLIAKSVFLEPYTKIRLNLPFSAYCEYHDDHLLQYLL